MDNYRRHFNEIWGSDPSDSISALAWIERVVERRLAEGVYVEFKQKKTPENPSLEEDDRTSFAKAISAFANTDGGLIVWGVEAKSSSKDEPDVAQSLRPIRNIRSFVASLNSLSASAVNPPLPGIDNRPVPGASGDDSGYAITVVPKRREPLTQAAMGRYSGSLFIRTGSGSHRIPQPLLTELLTRRPSPLLGVEVELVDRSDAQVFERIVVAERWVRAAPVPSAPENIPCGECVFMQGLRIGWTAWLTNQGLGSARDVAISLGVSGAEEWEACYPERDGVLMLPIPVHPGQKVAVCKGKLRVWASELEAGTSDLIVGGVAYAMDAPRFDVEARPKADEIRLYLPVFQEKSPPSKRYVDLPERWSEFRGE